MNQLITRTAGRPRDAAKQSTLLAALSADTAQFLEIGPPPYSVAHLAQTLQVDPSNLRKHLLRLEADALVLREVRPVETWSAIAGGHRPRNCICFWNVATMRQDKAAIGAWQSGAAERGKAAMAAFDRFR